MSISFANMPRLTSVMMLLALTVSCSDNSSNNKQVVDAEQLKRQQAVVEQLGSGVFLPTYKSFVQKADALVAATKTWADDPTAEHRQATQTAWEDAMNTWQRIEVYQVGPLGIMGTVAGGEDLRDEVYSWPLTNPCRVDQEIVANRFGDPQAFKSQLANVRGLDALGYLLLNEGTQNSCAPNSSINKDGQWAELDAAELDARRAKYANTLAVLIKGHADELVQYWDGGFLNTYTKANNDIYPSYQEALNATSDALFYVEKEAKDMKLGWSAGITKPCEGDACLKELELAFARTNKAHIVENLKAFQMVYLGNVPGEEDKPGFDDLLQGVGSSELDAQMQKRITDAIVAVEAINGSLYDAIKNNDPTVEAAYNAMKALTDLMRTQFISVLDLELPKRAEGDND